MDFDASMTRIHKIKKKIPTQVIKFIIVGSLNTTLSYILFFVLIHFFNLYYPVSLFFAYCFGIVHSYIWNKLWTFKSTKKKRTEIVKFVLVNVVTYFTNLFILYILIDVLRNSPEISQMIALVIVVVINFLGFKHWAFK